MLNALKIQKEWKGRESLPCRRLLCWSVSVLGKDQWRRSLQGNWNSSFYLCFPALCFFFSRLFCSIVPVSVSCVSFQFFPRLFLFVPLFRSSVLSCSFSFVRSCPLFPLFCSPFYRDQATCPQTSPAFAGLLFNPQTRSWVSHVCGVAAKTSTLKFYLMWQIWKIWGDKEFLSFISGKMEWESPPSVLVTRNPNWSQRSDTGTGCVKRRY